MKPRIIFRILILLCASALTVACGGSSYGGGNVSGIDRTGGPNFSLAFGTVTGFGSIIVNGVRYETSSSSFEIDGESGSQDDLKVGDVVFVRGTISDDRTTGTATTVIFDDNVEGPITSIDAETSTVAVMGQTVKIIDGETSFDNSFANPSFEGLALNQVVEVTGYVDSNEIIVATRIEPKLPGGELEITGVVDTHEPGTMMFTINDLNVDYSSVLALQNFVNGEIRLNDLVEVKGTDFNVGTNTLTATFVEFKGDRLPGNDNDYSEVEGLITRFVSRLDFDVYGIRVVASDQTTTFEGDIDNIGLNVKVEVDGNVDVLPDGTKVINATKVDVRRARIVRIEGAVDSATPSGDGSTGTVVVLGIDIEVDALTRREDKFNNPPLDSLLVSSLNDGDFVRIRGSLIGDPLATADVLAGLMELDDPDDTSLQGFVDAMSIDATAGTFTILGVTIDANTATTFRNADGSPIADMGAFFGLLQDGDLVKATGVEAASGTEIDADQIEFELEL